MTSTELVQLERSLDPVLPRIHALLEHSRIPPAQLVQTILVSAERNPGLLNANRQSLLAAAVGAAVLRLPVDGVTGQAYLIPFQGRVQLIAGYKGLITLAARSTFSVTANIVREADEFELELGSEPRIRHRPVLRPAEEQLRKLPIGAYAVFRSRFMPPVIRWMETREIMDVRDKSAGYKSGKADNPWRTHPTAMVLKTAIRHGAKLIPHETARDLSLATALEGAHDAGLHAILTEDHLVRVSPAEPEPAPSLPERLGMLGYQITMPGEARAREFRLPVDVLAALTEAKAGGADIGAIIERNTDAMKAIIRSDQNVAAQIAALTH